MEGSSMNCSIYVSGGIEENQGKPQSRQYITGPTAFGYMAGLPTTEPQRSAGCYVLLRLELQVGLKWLSFMSRLCIHLAYRVFRGVILITKFLRLLVRSPQRFKMNIVLFKRVSSGYEPCQFVKIHQRFRDYLCPHHKGNVLFCCKNCGAVMTVMSTPAAGIGLKQSCHIHLQTKRRNRRLAWVPVLVTVILLAITNEVSTDLPEGLSNYCSIVCGKYFCVVLLL